MSYFICLVYEGGVKAEGNGPRLNFHARTAGTHILRLQCEVADALPRVCPHITAAWQCAALLLPDVATARLLPGYCQLPDLVLRNKDNKSFYTVQYYKLY